MLNLCKRTHPVFQLTRQNLKSGYFYFISCIIHANSWRVQSTHRFQPLTEQSRHMKLSNCLTTR